MYHFSIKNIISNKNLCRALCIRIVDRPTFETVQRLHKHPDSIHRNLQLTKQWFKCRFCCLSSLIVMIFTYAPRDDARLEKSLTFTGNRTHQRRPTITCSSLSKKCKNKNNYFTQILSIQKKRLNFDRTFASVFARFAACSSHLMKNKMKIKSINQKNALIETVLNANLPAQTKLACKLKCMPNRVRRNFSWHGCRGTGKIWNKQTANIAILI